MKDNDVARSRWRPNLVKVNDVHLSHDLDGGRSCGRTTKFLGLGQRRHYIDILGLGIRKTLVN